MTDPDPLSSRNLAAMPLPALLWKRSVSLAVLGMILSPKWDWAYQFDAEWNATQHMASMSDGCGNDYFIGFSAHGVFVKGFDHESPMSPYHRTGPPDPYPQMWPNMYAGCPESLAEFRTEPAFSPEAATFCFWWDVTEPGWRRGVTGFAEGEDPDASYQGKSPAWAKYHMRQGKRVFMVYGGGSRARKTHLTETP
jgi:hypothetical protein